MATWREKSDTPVVRYTILLILCLAGSLAMFICGVNRESRVRAFRDHGEIVMGTVTEIREYRVSRRRGRPNFSYKPIVSFTTKGGISVRTETDDCSRDDYTAGQQVQIRYLPENPENAEIEGSGAQSFLNVFSLVGLGLLVIGWIQGLMLRMELRKTRVRSGLGMGWIVYFAICGAVGTILLICNVSLFISAISGEDKVLSANQSTAEVTGNTEMVTSGAIVGGGTSASTLKTSSGGATLPIPDFVKHGALGPKAKTETP